MRKFLPWCMFSFVVLLSSVGRSFGLQTESPSNTNNAGTPENAIFNGSDIDSVQMNNGGLTVSIPLVQNAG